MRGKRAARRSLSGAKPKSCRRSSGGTLQLLEELYSTNPVSLQNVQDQILAPRVHSGSLGLHPLGVIFALLAGAQIGGAVGAIFAIPVAGFIWIVLAATYRSLSTPAGPRIDSPTDSGLAAVSTTPSAVAVGERQD